MAKKHYYKRVWLNSKKGRAFLEIDDGYVTISDCGRSITIEFYFDGPKSLEGTMGQDERVAKLDNLIDNLSAYREWIKSRPRV